jgi:hypothetical protein
VNHTTHKPHTTYWYGEKEMVSISFLKVTAKNMSCPRGFHQKKDFHELDKEIRKGYAHMW